MKHNAQVRAYVPRQHYTPAELDSAALADWINDAECSERHAAQWTGQRRDELLSYAAECRAKAEQYKDGGAHKEMLKNG